MPENNLVESFGRWSLCLEAGKMTELRYVNCLASKAGCDLFMT
jgi:hypothetical protein